MRVHLTEDHYYDWEAFHEDIRNGMDIIEQGKKDRRGGYYTTKPRVDILDVERYEHDKKIYPPESVEYRLHLGIYSRRRRYYHQIEKCFKNDDCASAEPRWKAPTIIPERLWYCNWEKEDKRLTGQ